MKRIIVMGKPVAKARARVTRHGTYTPRATVEYEKLIKVEYVRQGGLVFEDGQPLHLEVDAFFAIPKGTPRAKRYAMAEGIIRPTIRPDWDNLGKIVSDALCLVAYRDDKQVVSCSVRKWYNEQPRIEFALYRVNADPAQDCVDRMLLEAWEK